MDDLISRKAAIDAIDSVFIDDESYKVWFKLAVKNLPSAQPESKTGEWEEKEIFCVTDDDPIISQWQSARCSECGKYHSTPYMYYFDNYNFCPNCGARMKGAKDV